MMNYAIWMQQEGLRYGVKLANKHTSGHFWSYNFGYEEHGSMLYEIGKWTPRKPGFGPLAVLESNTGHIPIGDSGYENREALCLLGVLFRESMDDRLWMDKGPPFDTKRWFFDAKRWFCDTTLYADAVLPISVVIEGA